MGFQMQVLDQPKTQAPPIDPIRVHYLTALGDSVRGSANNPGYVRLASIPIVTLPTKGIPTTYSTISKLVVCRKDDERHPSHMERDLQTRRVSKLSLYRKCKRRHLPPSNNTQNYRPVVSSFDNSIDILVGPFAHGDGQDPKLSESSRLSFSPLKVEFRMSYFAQAQGRTAVT
jgi:hypothetical protein